MANKYWLGSTSSSGSLWSVAGNWSGSGVPAATDAVYLNNSYRTASLNIDVSSTVTAFYATGYTGSMSIGKAGNQVDLFIGGPVGDFILDPSMSITVVNASPTWQYQNAHNSGSVNFNGVEWPGSLRPTIGFKLTGSITHSGDYILAVPNNTNVAASGSAGSAIYCRGNLTNGGATYYSFLYNIDFYMIGTGSLAIGSTGASNNNLNVRNFYISSSNGSGSFTVYGIGIQTGYGQPATFTGSFEYTTGAGLRLSNLAGTNGQLAISNGLASQLTTIQVNNKNNPSDRLQFEPGSALVIATANITPQNIAVMSDIVVNNNGILQLNPGATGTVAYNSSGSSRFIIKEGSVICNGGGGSNYNGTITCSFEGPSTYQQLLNNSTIRLPIIIDTGLSTLNFNNAGPMINTTEYRSGKINMSMAPDRLFWLGGTGTFLNAHKASLAGGNQFIVAAGTTTTMNEFPSGTPSKPVIVRSSTAGTNGTINLVDGLNPSYLPVSASYKIARNVIASNITVTGKPVYIYGRPVPQLLKPSYSTAQPYLLASRGLNVGIRYTNEMFYGRPVGNANNITTNIGGALTRNRGAMFNGWGNNPQATDPKTV